MALQKKKTQTTGTYVERVEGMDLETDWGTAKKVSDKEQVKEAMAMEEECQVEIQLIQEEVKRLGEQKKVLEDMIEYINVTHSSICWLCSLVQSVE